MKTEQQEWLSKNPFYTKRFAYYVGCRCHEASVISVARELRLSRRTVKELDKLYMEEQLRRAPPVEPKVIGVGEIAIGEGHSYRIVVSDLESRRAIWVGGVDRSQESMQEFYEWLGPDKSSHIRLIQDEGYLRLKVLTLGLPPIDFY